MRSELAIIFTCFNRKEKTVCCINSLLTQNNIPKFDFYICDDASTDGTTEAIKEICPDAVILQGTGDLFWSKGMFVAMNAAKEKNYDLYLMVNDDVEFFPDMWINLYEAYKENTNFGIVGCTLSKLTGKQSYGGANFIRNRKGDYIGPMLEPKRDEYVSCDLANWNCFLINREIIEKIGLIDSRYEHAMGDYDYSLRMVCAGYGLVLAKEYVGFCENNDKKNTFKDKNLSRKLRIKKLFAPNGLPVKSWFYFVFNYYRFGRLRNFFGPYIKYLIKILFSLDC